MASRGNFSYWVFFLLGEALSSPFPVSEGFCSLSRTSGGIRSSPCYVCSGIYSSPISLGEAFTSPVLYRGGVWSFPVAVVVFIRLFTFSWRAVLLTTLFYKKTSILASTFWWLLLEVVIIISWLFIVTPFNMIQLLNLSLYSIDENRFFYFAFRVGDFRSCLLVSGRFRILSLPPTVYS